MSAYLTAVGHVVGLLSADAELTAIVPAERIYEGVAPQDAVHPLITIQSYTDAADTTYNGGVRALTAVDLLIRVWDERPVSHGSSAVLVSKAADRVDALLSAAGPTRATGGTVASCQRVSEVQGTDLQGSAVIVRNAGGRYQLIVC